MSSTTHRTAPYFSLGLVASCLTVLALAACGGGGGDSAPAPAPTKAEGVYEGRVSNNLGFQLAILENDQFYSLIGTTDSQGVFRVQSLVEGRGTSSNGAITASNVREYVSDGQVRTGTLNGTFIPKTSVAGTITSAGASLTFSSQASPTTNYNYDTPATLAEITGAWPGETFTGEGVNFTVSATGSVSGTSQLGCAFTGSVVPRSSGKNVYDVSITYGTANCLFPGATFTGAALVTRLSSGQRQLVIAANNSARTAGGVVFATR